MQQLFYRINLPLLDVGRSSSDILLKKPNLYNLLLQIKRKPLAEVKRDHTCHYFSQRSNFNSCAAVQTHNDLMTMQEDLSHLSQLLSIVPLCAVFPQLAVSFGVRLIDDIREGSDILRRVEGFCIIFVKFLLHF